MKPMDVILSEAATFFESNLQIWLATCKKGCESPIEEMMVAGILAYWYSNYGTIPKFDENIVGDPGTHVRKQHQIGQHRVDFFIRSNDYDVSMVVECDGHDFHERTKEQAVRDRSRDRELTAKGYIVIRFTGSEIWKNPWACANEIERQIFAASYNRDNV